MSKAMDAAIRSIDHAALAIDHLAAARSAQEEKMRGIYLLAQRAAGRRSLGSGIEGREARLEACAELLAEIGVIHNTPNGKGDWIEGRE